MQPTLSNWQRGARLPLLVRPYPWMHPAAIVYLDSILRPEWRVLEHGSGGSTLWLSQRVAHVTAVEDRLEWYTFLHDVAPGNVTMIHSEKGDYIPTDIGPVDLLLIDGHPQASRPGWVINAPRLVRPGGVVVLDNANEKNVIMVRYVLEKCSEYAVTIHPHSTQRPLDTAFYFMKM